MTSTYLSCPHLTSQFYPSIHVIDEIIYYYYYFFNSGMSLMRSGKHKILEQSACIFSLQLEVDAD